MNLGVREVGEAEQIEAMLNQRYKEGPTFNPKIQDIQRFIKFFEGNPNRKEIFKDYYIFELKDGEWGMPCQVYLDQPYADTGLTAYFSITTEENRIFPLSDNYSEIGVPSSKISRFAQSIGAITALPINKANCYTNPNWSYLGSVPGVRITSLINQDFIIPLFEDLFRRPTLEMAKLIWKTMCGAPKNYLKACYQKSESRGAHYADSHLVCQLKSIAWIPQHGGKFVTPAKAIREQLPEGFPFDSGWDWIKAIEFGVDAAKQQEDQRKKREIAKHLGFKDEDELNDGTWFAKLSHPLCQHRSPLI